MYGFGFRGAVLLLALVACRKSEPTQRACVPGASIACACPGGGQGAQVCGSDGNSFGTCECHSAESLRAGQRQAEPTIRETANPAPATPPPEKVSKPAPKPAPDQSKRRREISDALQAWIDENGLDAVPKAKGDTLLIIAMGCGRDNLQDFQKALVAMGLDPQGPFTRMKCTDGETDGDVLKLE